MLWIFLHNKVIEIENVIEDSKCQSQDQRRKVSVAIKKKKNGGLLLFADDMILYIENPKDSNKNC